MQAKEYNLNRQEKNNVKKCLKRLMRECRQRCTIKKTKKVYTYISKPLYLPTMWVNPDGTVERLANKE